MTLAREGEKVLVSSVPKSGSHLIRKLLVEFGIRNVSGKLHRGGFYRMYGGVSLGRVKRELLLLPRGSFLSSHLFYDHEIKEYIRKSGIKVILMIRDPRDLVLSLASFIREEEHPYSPFFAKLTEDEVVKACITGYSKHAEGIDENHNVQGGVAETFIRILRWETHGIGKILRFEDLVGSMGGGSDDKQLEIIKDLAEYVGVDPGKGELERIAKNLFGGTATFRGGQIGKWKHKFTDEQKELFDLYAGDLLVRLGYEKNK